MGKVSLASLRINKGLTQREFAKEINVSPGTIGMYEIGKRVPSLSKAQKIAQYFGVALEEIEFGKNQDI